MRIWHEQLIPKLCRQHLLACWREGLGAYAIITGQVDGGSYKNHPAVKEFEDCSGWLYHRLIRIRAEMLHRGYKPKELPESYLSLREFLNTMIEDPKEWQTLEEQIEVLKSKKCKCNI